MSRGVVNPFALLALAGVGLMMTGSAFASQSVVDIRSDRFVLIGDSIAQGLSAPLSRQLDVRSATKAGSTAIFWRRRVMSIVRDAATSDKPTRVVIVLGTNDCVESASNACKKLRENLAGIKADAETAGAESVYFVVPGWLSFADRIAERTPEIRICIDASSAEVASDGIHLRDYSAAAKRVISSINGR